MHPYDNRSFSGLEFLISREFLLFAASSIEEVDGGEGELKTLKRYFANVKLYNPDMFAR